MHKFFISCIFSLSLFSCSKQDGNSVKCIDGIEKIQVIKAFDKYYGLVQFNYKNEKKVKKAMLEVDKNDKSMQLKDWMEIAIPDNKCVVLDYEYDEYTKTHKSEDIIPVMRLVDK